MNTEKNNEPQELKCPFCGKTPVYGVFVTSYYFRKEHKLYNSSENLIIPESENTGDIIGYPIEEIPNPSIRIASFRCGACNQNWLSSEYKIVSESNGSCSFVKKDMSKPREPSSTFYARFMDICKKNGVKPTPLIKSLGLSTGNLKKWSEGSTVNSDIVKKLAAYFGVSPGFELTIGPIPETGAVSEIFELANFLRPVALLTGALGIALSTFRLIRKILFPS